MTGSPPADRTTTASSDTGPARSAGAGHHPLQSWRGWASGRQLRLTGGLWALAFVGVYVWWWRAVDWPWASFGDSYSINVVGVVPALAGAMAIYGVLPGADWIDLQAVTHPQRRDTIAAGLLVVAFSAIPPLVRWLFTLSDFYLNFVSEGALAGWMATPDAPVPFHYFWDFGLGVGITLGATLLLVGVVGRPLGPLTGVLCYSGLLTLQSWRLAPGLIPRLDEPRTALSLTTGLLTVVIGLTVFRLSRSGARPLIG
ncbi:MAG: hypothetical protein KIT69_08665 [Propionibacteriaceae bacterium]|nr:hypothetical protein [Propionibacteriaceae bacterium]